MRTSATLAFALLQLTRCGDASASGGAGGAGAAPSSTTASTGATTGSGGAASCAIQPASGAPDVPLPANVAADVEAALAAYAVPSASIAVMRDGQVLGLAAFGEADPLAPDMPVTANVETPYALGSLSKPLLGVMIHQLAEGGLDLDADVSALVGVDVRSPGHPATPITVRQLLTHTAGIADRVFTYDGTYYVAGDSPIAFGDFVRGYFDPASPYFGGATAFTGAEPGSEICYSNMGAALLGLVVESVSGEALPSYARERVFEPLGMTRTSYLVADYCAPAELARGCDVSGGDLISADNGRYGQPESHPELASGVVRSTAADVARFVSAIARGGELGGERVLEEASVEAMLAADLGEALPECADGRVVSENQGHMWIHFPFDGDDYVGHYGGIYGFYTTGYVRVSDGLVVVVLLNRLEPAALNAIEVSLLGAF